MSEPVIVRQTLVEGLDQYKALGYAGLTIGTAIVYRQADQPARLAIVKVERAAILRPQRRSIVSSPPISSGPVGTKIGTNRTSSVPLTARLDQTARWSTR